MHKNLKLKTLAMLFAMLASFFGPVLSISSAQAQVSSGGRPNVNRAQARQHVNRAQANRHHGNRSHVNRSHVRSQHNRARPHVNHRSRTHVRHHNRNNIVIVQPRRHWNHGGAVAAGAAIGFIAGASAASWAGPPPRAGYCWFYTNRARTHGFWDWCPR